MSRTIFRYSEKQETALPNLILVETNSERTDSKGESGGYKDARFFGIKLR